MEKLKTYLKKNQVTVSQAAREIGVTRQHLHCALRGQPMGRRTAKKIEEWTDGAIPAAELMQI